MEGQRLLELARSVKCAQELQCIRESVAVADLGMSRMREVLRPGITENELWAELHYANIAHGGEWIETRLLSSGPRTNPWFQEASDRRIQAGELVSFDTDMVGPHGYCADISRTSSAHRVRLPPRNATSMGSRPSRWRITAVYCGRDSGFRDFARLASVIPAQFVEQNYGCLLHGVGMVDEWPAIGTDPQDPLMQEGELAPGMTVCVESYMGEAGGIEGVKLEQQVLITPQGHEILSCFPLEPDLL